MATITTKVCDRCGAQHVQDRTSTYKVQQVKWLIPISDSLHQTGEHAKELCTPCRRRLSEWIVAFMKGEVQ